MKNRLIWIKEPELTFGYNQRTSDPRDGLLLFGPWSRGTIKTSPVGVAGTLEGIRRMDSWLDAIQQPVTTRKKDVARPFFPGLEAAFDFQTILYSIVRLNVDESKLDTFLHYTDPHQRVHNLANLYANRILEYCNTEEFPVTVWFVVIPDAVKTYGRPQSRIPASKENIRVGIKSKLSRIMPMLFSQDQQLQEAYKYEVNFHNQLKAKLLEKKIITQIVRESTIAYRELHKSEQLIEREEKFDSAKAWSISTTLYYKCGGLPWKLANVREGVCYIGLVYKRMDTDYDRRNACCAAQMFLDSGDGQVFRTVKGPYYNPDKDEYHLTEEGATDLMKRALRALENKGIAMPKEMFIHAKTYFDDVEWKAFEAVTQGKIKLTGVRIRDERVIKLYRDFAYPVPRGSAFFVDDTSAFLWTRGFVPRLQSNMGLETPNPLSVQVTRGDADIETVCKDILMLTKLNYNACIYGDGLPVTLRFADAVGEILTAGPWKEEIEALPFKHYI
jgi:hypothetical protein